MPDEVHIKLPSICGDNPDIVRKLLRALCNHSKSGNLWKTDFINFMVQEDFQWCSRDMQLFVRPMPFFLLVLHVNDMLAAYKCNHFLDKFWSKLPKTFKIKDLENPQNFLGIEVNCIPIQWCVALTAKIHTWSCWKFNLSSDLWPVIMELHLGITLQDLARNTSAFV